MNKTLKAALLAIQFSLAGFSSAEIDPEIFKTANQGYADAQ